MRLIQLDCLESLNNQEIKFIVGGTVTSLNSECWEDSTSRDSIRRDKGGCSKRKDEPAFAAY